ncbi:GNAT family N-acetyltransferase [Dictyobacter kobayashii]|uniref:GNAT family N-acetyltransferase n=1 Tax=Dictyobacter kobayashii TaxID=2014872 RepID=UPI00353135DE
MHIMDLTPEDTARIQQVTKLLVEGFSVNHADAWPDMNEAAQEVEELFAAGRISRIALAEDGMVLGWIGGISQYDGRVWEIHPLVVDVNYQGQGIGRALVRDLEELVRQRGGMTITLGTDDEYDQTTLSGVNLFPDPYIHIARIQNLKRHPYEFYQKLGYSIVGVVPDANGIGKPDILMARSLVR